MASLLWVLLFAASDTSHAFVSPTVWRSTGGRQSISALPTLLAGPNGLLEKRSTSLSMAGIGSAPYRLLGVTEDAGYDDVMSAYMRLTQLNADDKEKVAQLETAKDQILRARMEQRMSGAPAAKGVQRSAFDMPEIKKTPLLKKLSEKITPVFGLPKGETDIALVKKGTYLQLAMGFATLTGPSGKAAKITFFFQSLVALGTLTNKGLPPVVKDDTGAPGEVRSAKPAVQRIALIALAVFGGLGYVVFTLLRDFGLRMGWATKQMGSLGLMLGWWVATIVIKTNEVVE